MWERVGLPAKDVQATIQRLRESAGAFSPFHVSGSKQSPSASSQSRPPSWGSRSSVGNGHGEDFSRLPSPGARICKDLGKTAVGPVHWLVARQDAAGGGGVGPGTPSSTATDGSVSQGKPSLKHVTFDDPEDSPQNVKPIYTPSGTKAHTPSPSTLLEQEQNQPLSALLAGSISAAPRRWSDSDIYTGLLKFVSSSPAGDAKERESEGGRRERKADVRERGGGEAERMRVLVLELARAKLCLRISNDSEEKLVQMLKQERKNAQLLVEKVRRQSKEDMVALEQEVHTLLQQMEAQVTEERARARRQAQELSGLQGCIAELRESNCTAHTSVNSRLLCERAWRGWSELWATSSERRHVILTCVRSRARRRQLEHAMDTWVPPPPNRKSTPLKSAFSCTLYQ